MGLMLNKFGRVYVESAPKEVHKAVRPCRVQLWVVSKLHSDQQFETASVVFMASSLDACSPRDGVPLPFDTVISVDLDTGEALWAASFNRAFVGYSVLERAV